MKIFSYFCREIFCKISFLQEDNMKDKILHTALDLFMKYGIREMSIQKLIVPLGISTKTVYKYYKNKEDLLENVLSLFQEQRYNAFKAYKDKKNAVSLFLDIWYSGVENEFNVNNKFFNDLKVYYPELNSKYETELGHKVWEQLLQVFMIGQKDGIFINYLMPEVAFEGISVLFNAITRTEQFSKFNSTSFQIFCNTIVPCIRGFCTAKGLEQLEEHVKGFNIVCLSGSDVVSAEIHI